VSPPSSDRPDASVSRLAHELKTPLAVITGFAELLAMRDDERTRVEASARITDASRQLSSVLDDLLGGIAADTGDLGQRLVDALEAERGRREEQASP
jgi:signal transduction histidine kinase